MLFLLMQFRQINQEARQDRHRYIDIKKGLKLITSGVHRHLGSVISVRNRLISPVNVELRHRRGPNAQLTAINVENRAT